MPDVAGLPTLRRRRNSARQGRSRCCSKEWQKAVEDGQKFMNAFTTIAENGKGLGGS
jgi:hypothetical protein